MDWGLVAAIAGGAAAFVGGVVADVVRSRLNIGEARAERVATRAAFKEDRRVAFELDTLLALQESVQRKARAAGSAQHLDEMHYRETGEWGTQPHPSEIGGEAALKMGQEFIRLRSRVFDADLRGKLDAFHTSISQHAVGLYDAGADEVSKRTYAEERLLIMANQLEEIQEQIGRRLQELYET